MGANLALTRRKKKLAAAVVQLAGSVLIWHVVEWFSTACCLYGARSKNKNTHCDYDFISAGSCR
jgi:hypothetical protein